MVRLKPIMVLAVLGLFGCGKSAAPKVTDEKATQEPAPASQETTPEPSGPEVVEIEEIFTLPAADDKSSKLDAAAIKQFLANDANHQPIIPAAPVGLDDPAKYIPEESPLTRAKVELGRLLYFDPRLSKDETISCASCHDPEMGWADASPVSTGIGGQKGGRSAPTVMNRLYGKTQFWDGRAASLEEQSLGPIANPIEMGFTHDLAVERLKGIEGYQLFFDKVYGDINADNIANAIAAFERTVLVGGSPNDYYEAAKPGLSLEPEEIEELDEDVQASIKKKLADHKAHPMSEAAMRGRKLYFGKAECSLCHVGYNLSDELFYNIGVGMNADKPDEGRSVISKNDKELGAFKTPSLRNIKDTAPYMHDGSQMTLMDVVKWYNQGGHPHTNLHPRIKKLNLTDDEMKDLVIFMEEGLSGPVPNIPPPQLP
ncbi:Cytochrome c551 peroxidase precursor [Planctomycetes bacterium Pan216]|uniref:Methylamine utilization protein MauG n=1 Tax=Kolteria novifilia TaxID=2527975 RepID=A0A518B0T3_9BACT|nr:Cytochrome c551 peroxidase precursor [Planctomycetes bacterium Pan216]